MRILLTCLLVLPLVACQQSRAPGISHVVLFDLQDPADAADLVADCDRLLTEIESVEDYTCGYHVDTGRGELVAGDYDVGLHVSFRDLEGYEAYIVHPLHVQLVDAWGSRFEGVRIYDFGRTSDD